MPRTITFSPPRLTTTSLPELRIKTASGKLVKNVIHAGEAPTIELQEPVPSGTVGRDVPAAPLGGAAYQTPEAYRTQFRVSGRVTDILGVNKLRVEADTIGIVLLPRARPFETYTDAQGKFAFTFVAEGHGQKVITLRCTGNSGAVGIMVITGQLGYGPRYLDVLSRAAGRLTLSFDGQMKRDDTLLYGATTVTNIQPASLPPLDEQTLNHSSGQDANIFFKIDNQRDKEEAQELRNSRVTWSAGRGIDLLANKIVSNEARYQVELVGAPSWVRRLKVDITPDVKIGSFMLRGTGGPLLSYSPEAFVVAWAYDDPYRGVPGRPKDVFMACVLTGETDHDLDTTVPQIPPLLPQPVNLEFEHQFVVVTSDRYVFLSRGPRGLIRTTQLELLAQLQYDDGLVTDPQHYEWAVVYGPDPAAATLVPGPGNHSTCKFWATIPGTYTIQARVHTDHDSEIAVGIAEVEVLETQLVIQSDELQTTENPGTPLTNWVQLLKPESTPFGYQLRFFGDGGQLRAPDLGSVEVHWTGQHWARIMALDIPVPFDQMVKGVWTGFDSTNAEDVVQYSLAQNLTLHPTATIDVKAQLTAVVLPSGSSIDVSSLGISDEIPNILIRPGPPARVEARIISPGGSIVRNPVMLTPVPPTGPVSAASFDLFGIGDPTSMKLSIKALDDHGNSCSGGTSVHFEVKGPGELIRSHDPRDIHSEELDDDGSAWIAYEVSPEVGSDYARSPLTDVLFEITVAEQLFLIGHPLAGANFVLYEIDHQTTPVDPAQDLVVDKILTGDAHAGVQITLPNGTPVAQGTKVSFHIFNGGIKASPSDKFMPNCQGEVGLGGKVEFWVSPKCLNADGTPHPLKADAWGDVNLDLAVGEGHKVVIVRFSELASFKKCPRVRFPAMNFVDQANYRWIERRDAVPPGQPPSPLASGPGEIHGESGRSALLELLQDPQDQLYALFNFDRTPAGSSPYNPTLPNDAPVDPKLPPLKKTIDLAMRPGTGLPAALGGYLGHASIDRTMPRSPQGRGALKLESSTLGSLAWRFGLRYAAKVPGSAGFSLSFYFRPTSQQSDWEVLRLEGSDANDDRVEPPGFLSIRYRTKGSGAFLEVEYEAGECPVRTRVTMPAPILVPVTAGRWNPIGVKVMPSLENGTTTVEVVQPVSRLRTIGSFNFLPGSVYYISLGVPDAGSAHIDALSYSAPQSGVLHLVRSSDNLHTPWLEVPIGPSRVEPLLFERHEMSHFTTPVFKDHVDRFAVLTVGYCDAPDIEPIQIAAIDVHAAKVYRYVSDIIGGFVFGESQTLPGSGGDFAAGMLGWGDLRDVVKNLAYAMPGMGQPDWDQFWRSLIGLGLDVAQLFTAGGAAAPNVFLKIVNVCLNKLKPLIRALPEARLLVAFFGKVLRKVLVDWRLLRIAQAIRQGYDVAQLAKLLENLAEFIVTYMFENVGQRELKAFVNYALKALAPASPVLVPFAQISAISSNAGADAQVLAIALERLFHRVELFGWVLNPKPWANQIASFFQNARRRGSLRDEKRVLALVETSARSWRLKVPQGNAAKEMAIAMREISRVMKSRALQANPKLMRGLATLVAACGPQRVSNVLKNLCPNQQITPLCRRVLRDADEARRVMGSIKLRNAAGFAWSPREEEQLKTLNRLMFGLAGRTKRGLPDRRSINGALCGLRDMARKAHLMMKGGEMAPYMVFVTRGGAKFVQDLYLKINHALESKSFLGGASFFRSRMEGMAKQLERWVWANRKAVQFNKALPKSSPFRQRVLDKITYSIHVQKGQTQLAQRVIDRMRTARNGWEMVARLANEDYGIFKVVFEIVEH